jgi:hypothetical protein
MLAAALVISHREMRVAAAAGRARQLIDEIPEFRRYCGQWWVISPEGWLRITDTHLAGCLDTVKMRLDVAKEMVSCERAEQRPSSCKGEDDSNGNND